MVNSGDGITLRISSGLGDQGLGLRVLRCDPTSKVLVTGLRFPVRIRSLKGGNTK